MIRAPDPMSAPSVAQPSIWDLAGPPPGLVLRSTLPGGFRDPRNPARYLCHNVRIYERLARQAGQPARYVAVGVASDDLADCHAPLKAEGATPAESMERLLREFGEFVRQLEWERSGA